jgi:hypothetical protein
MWQTYCIDCRIFFARLISAFKKFFAKKESVMKKALVISALICSMVFIAAPVFAGDNGMKMPDMSNVGSLLSARPASQNNVSSRVNVSAPAQNVQPAFDLGKAYSNLAGGVASAYNTAASVVGNINPAHAMGTAGVMMMTNPVTMPLGTMLTAASVVTVNDQGPAGAVSQMTTKASQESAISQLPAPFKSTSNAASGQASSTIINSAVTTSAVSTSVVPTPAAATTKTVTVSTDGQMVIIPQSVHLTGSQQKGMQARGEIYGSRSNIVTEADLTPAQKATLDRVRDNQPLTQTVTVTVDPQPTGKTVDLSGYTITPAPAERPVGWSVMKQSGGNIFDSAAGQNAANPQSAGNLNAAISVNQSPVVNVSPSAPGMDGLTRVTNQLNGQKLSGQ